MKKKIERKGKQMLPIIENKVYSALLFQIAFGNNYAQKIYESIGKPTSILFRQLRVLEKNEFVTSVIEEDKSTFPMKRLRIYLVNWDKINEEFVDYIFEVVSNKRRELKAYFGDEYESYIKEQEQVLDTQKKGYEFPVNSKFERLHNEEKVFKKFEKLIKSKRLNKNKYLQILFEIIFRDYSKTYVKNNIPVTIKSIFEEVEKSFGFENFNNYVWTKMLDIVVYKEKFPYTNNLEISPENYEKHHKEQKEKFEQVRKRYSKLSKDKNWEDIQTLQISLRFAFWGFIVPNASFKMAQKLIKKNNLITEQEIEEYKSNRERS